MLCLCIQAGEMIIIDSGKFYKYIDSGVVETGLFVEMADHVYFGQEDGSTKHVAADK